MIRITAESSCLIMNDTLNFAAKLENDFYKSKQFCEIILLMSLTMILKLV